MGSDLFVRSFGVYSKSLKFLLAIFPKIFLKSARNFTKCYVFERARKNMENKKIFPRVSPCVRSSTSSLLKKSERSRPSILSCTPLVTLRIESLLRYAYFVLRRKLAFWPILAEFLIFRHRFLIKFDNFL